MKIVITGSLSYDYIMDFSGRFRDRIMPDKLHILSLSFLADKCTKQFGGCAVNIAYSLKLLGMNPSVVTAAGNDWREYKAYLRKQGISVAHIREYADEPCSSYHVITDKDDNQIGAFYIGASRYNDRLKIPADADFVVIGPTDPKAMLAYLRQCRTKRYLYDPSFQIAHFTDGQLRAGIRGAEILIGNDYEMELIKRRVSVTCPVVVTTLGAKGSVIASKSGSVYIKPVRPKNTGDPTGAGDAYRAGFLAGYLRGYDLTVCGQMGSVAAAYTVERYGTQTHAYSRSAFIKRYKDTYGGTIAL